MRGKFVAGMTAGALMGAAMGMMLMPGMDRSTKRRIRKATKYVKDAAGDAYDDMRGRMS